MIERKHIKRLSVKEGGLSLKKYANLILLVIFMGHFTLLAGYFLKNFDAIAYAKFSLRMERPLEIDNTASMRDFGKIGTAKAKKVTVLMYHRIIDRKDLKEHHFDKSGELHDTIVTLQNFEEQMRYLKEQGYTTLTMPEFQSYMEEELEVPAKSVLITFDDGFKDNYINAYPVLKKHKFHATIFLITGNMERKSLDYNPSEIFHISHLFLNM